jgi:hypothetical protein
LITSIGPHHLEASEAFDSTLLQFLSKVEKAIR